MFTSNHYFLFEKKGVIDITDRKKFMFIENENLFEIPNQKKSNNLLTISVETIFFRSFVCSQIEC